MTKADVARVLAVLRAAYPSHQVGDEKQTVAVWQAYLGDLESEDILRAVNEHIASSRFWPAISEIREIATKPDMPDLDQAWGEVMHAVGSVGRYRSPVWSSPAVAAAVDALGWEAICNTREQDVGTMRAQFRDAYRAATNRTARDANVGRLHEARSGRALSAGEALLLSERKDRS